MNQCERCGCNISDNRSYCSKCEDVFDNSNLSKILANHELKRQFDAALKSQIPESIIYYDTK